MDKYAEFEGARPYFELVRRALDGLVEGEHFFDVVAGNIVFQVLYDLGGWPRVIRGRTELMNQFKGYCANVRLESADRLAVHKADEARLIVIEYDVHGRILANNARYHNRFCSILELANRRIARWRDYMDSLAAWNALTAKHARSNAD